MLDLQGDLASAEMPGTWYSDELPDAEALVSLTFRLLFPDTFQHILPVHKHKVVSSPPQRQSSMPRISQAQEQRLKKGSSSIAHQQSALRCKKAGFIVF